MKHDTVAISCQQCLAYNATYCTHHCQKCPHLAHKALLGQLINYRVGLYDQHIQIVQAVEDGQAVDEPTVVESGSLEHVYNQNATVDQNSKHATSDQDDQKNLGICFHWWLGSKFPKRLLIFTK